MYVVYLIFVLLLDLSIDACYARSFGVDRVVVWNSKIKLYDQAGKNLVELMKMNLKEEGRNDEEKAKNSEEGKNCCSNLVWKKHFVSVSLSVLPENPSSDHYSDYDRPKPNPPSHN